MFPIRILTQQLMAVIIFGIVIHFAQGTQLAIQPVKIIIQINDCANTFTNVSPKISSVFHYKNFQTYTKL